MHAGTRLTGMHTVRASRPEARRRRRPQFELRILSEPALVGGLRSEEGGFLNSEEAKCEMDLGPAVSWLLARHSLLCQTLLAL